MWWIVGIVAYAVLAVLIWAVVHGGTGGAEHDERQYDDYYERVYRHNKAKMARKHTH